MSPPAPWILCVCARQLGEQLGQGAGVSSLERHRANGAAPLG